MKEIIKNIIKSVGPAFFFYKKSYAQEGEDLAVNRLLLGKKNGFYIDVGAHHPFRFSNTYFFYKKGWSGICIDPLPGTKNKFRFARPRDTVIEVGISAKPGKLKYFMFNEPALNTFDESIAQERDGKKGYKVVKAIEIETKPLSSILSESVIPQSGIDLLSVDVEGFDYEVLISMDLKKYRPKIIICECLGMNLNNGQNDPIFALLTNLEYELYAKTGHSMIFTLNT